MTLLASGISTPKPKVKAEKLPVAKPASTMEKLEAAVLKTYRETEKLEFEVHGTWDQSNKKVLALVEQGSDSSSKILALVLNGLDSSLCETSHDPIDGAGQVRMKEHNFLTGAESEELVPANLVATYMWPVPKTFDGCDFGIFIRSWIGRHTYFQDWLTRVFPAATDLKREKLGNDWCQVVYVNRSPNFKEEKFYFDQKTHRLRRWTFIKDGVSRRYDLIYRS